MRSSLRDGTSMVNAIERPSGDHCASAIGSMTRVICEVAPSASIQRTKICSRPAESAPAGVPTLGVVIYRMRVPSGDQRAREPRRRNRLREPSAPITQSSDCHRSAMRSTCWRV
jgi:hypothetical protein